MLLGKTHLALSDSGWSGIELYGAECKFIHEKAQ